jgi:hypothetical protein
MTRKKKGFRPSITDLAMASSWFTPPMGMYEPVNPNTGYRLVPSKDIVYQENPSKKKTKRKSKRKPKQKQNKFNRFDLIRIE